MKRTSYVVIIGADSGKSDKIAGFCDSKESAEDMVKDEINDGNEAYLYKMISYKAKVSKIIIEEPKDEN